MYVYKRKCIPLENHMDTSMRHRGFPAAHKEDDDEVNSAAITTMAKRKLCCEEKARENLHLVARTYYTGSI